MRGVGETFFVSKQALRFLGPSAQGRRNARVKASLRSTSRNICMDGLFTSKPRMMWARTLYICGLKKGTVYGHVCNDHAGGPSMYIQIYVGLFPFPVTVTTTILIPPMYGLYNGCIGQYGVIFWGQLLGYPPKCTRIFAWILLGRGTTQ